MVMAIEAEPTKTPRRLGRESQYSSIPGILAKGASIVQTTLEYVDSSCCSFLMKWISLALEVTAIPLRKTYQQLDLPRLLVTQRGDLREAALIKEVEEYYRLTIRST